MPPVSPEMRAERKRVGDLIGHMIDRALEEHDAVPHGSFRETIYGAFAADLAKLAKTVRDGGTLEDLQRL